MSKMAEKHAALFRRLTLVEKSAHEARELLALAVEAKVKVGKPRVLRLAEANGQAGADPAAMAHAMAEQATAAIGYLMQQAVSLGSLLGSGVFAMPGDAAESNEASETA